MTVQRGNHPDAARSRLRAMVAKVNGELARLPAQGAAGDEHPTSALHAVWAELVDELALGPEPEVRTCPTCGHIGMRKATVCGHCWTHLEPPS